MISVPDSEEGSGSGAGHGADGLDSESENTSCGNANQGKEFGAGDKSCSRVTMFSIDCKHRINIVLDTYDSKMDLTIFPKTKGKELFDRVIETLGIKEAGTEADFFGIAYTKFDGAQAWLEDDKEIYQQRFQRSEPIEFYFKYKLFPADVETEITHETSLKILYLQVRLEILSGRIFCPKSTAVDLASYAAQVKFGNFESLGHGTDYLKKSNDRWVPSNVLKDNRDRLAARQVREAIANLHKQHYGKTIGEAMKKYLTISQSLSMYGLTDFSVSIRIGDEKQKCGFGITPHDIRVYEANNLTTPAKYYSWKDVISCSPSTGKIKIKLRSHLTDPDFEIVSKQSNQIYDLCAGYHRIYTRRRKASNSENLLTSSKSSEDGRMEHALKQETDARERVQQENEMLRERLSLIVDKLRESEKENDILRQKLVFTEERIRVWKSQLSAKTQDQEEKRPNSEIDCSNSNASQNYRQPNSRIQRPTPVRRSLQGNNNDSISADVHFGEKTPFKSRLPVLKSSFT